MSPRKAGSIHTFADNEFENTPDKVSGRDGDPPASLRQLVKGFAGLQNHGGADAMRYRNILVEHLSADAVGKDPTGAFEVTRQARARFSTRLSEKAFARSGVRVRRAARRRHIRQRRS